MAKDFYNTHFKSEVVSEYRKSCWTVDRLFDNSVKQNDLRSCINILADIAKSISIALKEQNTGKASMLKSLYSTCSRNLQKFQRDQTYRARREWRKHQEES